MIEDLKELIPIIKEKGCWLTRYGEIFYCLPEEIKIEVDKQLSEYYRETVYVIYFCHNSFPATICSCQLNWANYKTRFALTKEGLESK